jgi:glutaredoxin
VWRRHATACSKEEERSVLALTVYTSGGCSSCEAVVRALASQGTPYELVDIDRSPAGARELARLTGGHQIVPTVVDECGEVLIGPGSA